jgi:signal transduction histidine kinase
MTRRTLAPPIVLAVGVAAAASVAVSFGMPAHDAGVLLATTGTGSILTAAAGRWLFGLRAHRSLRDQVLLVAALAVATVVAGVLAAAQAMFISTHDLHALLVVTTLAAAVSVSAAVAVLERFDEDAESVVRLAQGLSTPSADGVGLPPTFALREMHDLGLRLEETSAELEVAHQRERSLERSRRELVAWVSHDLRSPLASIRALAEALEDGIAADDADHARYYRSIRQESERLTELVDDLFELSQIQAGSPRKASMPLPVREMIDDAIDGVIPAAEVKGVRIEAHLHGMGDTLVPAADVARAVRNLLDNAVRHTPIGGLVRIEGSTDGLVVVLSVVDQCGGIPDADIDRVFDTAFRGDAARGRDGSGGGLGLAIARGLVESHAGQIDVRNHDRGCEFRVRIPSVGGPG